MRNNFCNETILIVDDEEDIREILGSYFEKNGAKVLTAGNGLEAFEVLQSNSVNAIISDVCMAEMDGEEFLRQLRQTEFALVPFFFISGNAHFTSEAVDKFGARGAFEKPFNFDEIIRALGQALGLTTPA